MPSFTELCAILGRHYSPSSARTIVRLALRRIGVAEGSVDRIEDPEPLLRELRRGMDLFAASATARKRCGDQLEALFRREKTAHEDTQGVEVAILSESNIVDARTRARGLAAELGFGRTQQVKVATVVSELARNIYHYAGSGLVRVDRLRAPRPGLKIEARDQGPGITDVEAILAGAYRSRTGLGLGLIGCRNLADQFEIETVVDKGTAVRVWMYR